MVTVPGAGFHKHTGEGEETPLINSTSSNYYSSPFTDSDAGINSGYDGGVAYRRPSWISKISTLFTRHTNKEEEKLDYEVRLLCRVYVSLFLTNLFSQCKIS